MTSINKGDMQVGNASGSFSILSAPADGSMNIADSTQTLGYNTIAKTAFAQVANNLSDLASASTARTNLGLGTASTFASAAFMQGSNNLSDVSSAATARTNLGLGTASTLAIKSGSATLTLGTVTVSDTAVTSSSKILLTASSSSSVGVLRVTSQTAGTGFVITSSLLTDSGAVAYLIVG